ncbi:putative ribonuclease H protein [Corchorus olitorius]|uniref:Ribonuclease H protein n=1 Tax=Corchorus olitorius TaxID=93759 RepID=A0A1R3JCA3_9ROSI|nr:putative ribonuclease H protein [Corchorus olitorius]
MNVALLAKTGWKLHTQQQSLCTQVFEQKYLRGLGFVDADSRGRRPSTWRGIKKTIDCVRKSTRWNVGNGESINLWLDWWMGDRPLIHDMLNEEASFDRHVKVASIIGANGEWYLDGLGDLLSAAKLEEIRAIPLFLSSPKVDRCTWAWTRSGHFATNMAYGSLANLFAADALVVKYQCGASYEGIDE